MHDYYHFCANILASAAETNSSYNSPGHPLDVQAALRKSVILPHRICQGDRQQNASSSIRHSGALS